MSTLASLLPQLREVALDATGTPMAGALLYSYAAGTATPLATYSDAALTTPNSNPVVANSGGLFPPIYLSNTGYKFDLQSSAAVSLFTSDPVYPPGYIASNAVQNQIAATCAGRLTLTTGVPVTTADVTAATTLRFTPYKGASIGLYDGSQWNLRTFSELSIAVPATTSQMYDVFVFDNSGTAALELLAWTNDTTRATALTTQDGIYVKTGALTRRYVGSFRTTAVSGQTEDSLTKRYMWNYYNRVRRPMRRIDGAVTWNYTTAAFRQANGSTANQFDVVVGVAEVSINVLVQASATNAVANSIAVAVGEDSTSTTATGCVIQVGAAVSGENNPTSASLFTMPAIGRHFYAWLEYSTASGTTTWNGTGAVFAISGMSGSMEG
jgi:hypothetical protein